MPQPYLVSSIPEPQLFEFYRLMTEEIGDVAVFFMDPTGIISTWNRAAEEMKGYTAEEAIGQNLAVLYTHEDRQRGWPEHNLNEAIRLGYYKEETWRRKKDGTRFWARICLTALKDDSGEVLGFSKITLDLTDHKLLESCVAEREHTRRVLRAADAGTWRWNPEKSEVSVCENFLNLLGYSGHDATISFSDWLDYFHEDDRPKVRSKLEAARDGTPVEAEFRLRLKDGNYRWFFSRAEWHRELDAQPWELSGVNVQIEGLKAAEQDVREAMQKLRDADVKKDDFLAMLAHELRNPLAPIRAAAEVMRRSAGPDEKLGRASEIVLRQCEHLTSLVDDLLDVSRVTRGLVQIQKTPQSIRHILTDALEQAAPLIQARQHHLSVKQAPQSATVLGDEKRMVQVLSNLLNNSAKYTPQGGHIEVSTEMRDGSLHISVMDNGIGMESGTAEHAFELFTQGKRTPDRSGGGLGLGLALVKSLVELHGGDVWCESEGLGKGSTFTVRLPLVQAQGEGEPEPCRFEATGAERPLRVMVVDDNLDAAEMLGMLLDVVGHNVTLEPTAQSALSRSRSSRFDVFLLDIGLPDLDGHELARRLKAQPETKDALLVAVTGYGQDADRNEAMAAGFSHHLVKPVDPERLLAILNEVTLKLGGTAKPPSS